MLTRHMQAFYSQTHLATPINSPFFAPSHMFVCPLEQNQHSDANIDVLLRLRSLKPSKFIAIPASLKPGLLVSTRSYQRPGLSEFRRSYLTQLVPSASSSHFNQRHSTRLFLQAQYPYRHNFPSCELLTRGAKLGSNEQRSGRASCASRETTEWTGHGRSSTKGKAGNGHQLTAP